MRPIGVASFSIKEDEMADDTMNDPGQPTEEDRARLHELFAKLKTRIARATSRREASHRREARRRLRRSWRNEGG